MSYPRRGEIDRLERATDNHDCCSSANSWRSELADQRHRSEACFLTDAGCAFQVRVMDETVDEQSAFKAGSADILAPVANPISAPGLDLTVWYTKSMPMPSIAETAAVQDDGSLSERAMLAIRRMIFSGDLPGGTIIQDRKLAEQLGLSRTPVREALGRLAGEGYLRRDGRLLTVQGVSVEDVMEILATRRALEGETARLAAGRLPPANSPESAPPSRAWPSLALSRMTGIGASTISSTSRSRRPAATG